MEDNELPSYEAAMAVEQNKQKINGVKDYETNSECCMLPSAPPLPPEGELEAMHNLFIRLTDEEIREACHKYARKHCDLKYNAFEKMEFTNVHSSFSLHYKLETLTENRQVATGYSHYYKQNIDGAKNGPEPDPWSIIVEPPSHFKDYHEPIIIPHTEKVKTCHQCDGRGKEDCLICEGAGWTYCKICSPTTENRCQHCRSGRVTCNACNETGRIKCRICDGYKKLKHFKELKVIWKTHIDHFVENATTIPNDLLQSSTCKEIFREERPLVHPLQNFPHLPLTSEASLHLIDKHKRMSAKDEIIRMQRQTLRAVPITKVNYKYKDKEGEFYVYGLERSVYFESSLLKSSSCCIS